MPRPGLTRILSVALLLVAGSFEPAWELGHAVLHFEAAHNTHDLSEHDRHPADAASLSILASNDEAGHEHPVFQSPVRPDGNLILAVVALPATGLELPIETLTVRSPAFPGAPARASPIFAHTTQPRAPPRS